MVLRTARRGANAGSQFWGCPDFFSPSPDKCTGTRPFGDSRDVVNDGSAQPATSSRGASSTPSSAPNPQLSPWEMPRVVRAPSFSPAMQATFFQSCAVPKAVVEAIFFQDVSRSTVASMAQWRLDHPLPFGELDEQTKSILGIVETLLSRGSCSFLMPELEQDLAEGFEAFRQDPKDVARSLIAAAAHPVCSYVAHSFDSPEEEQLYALLTQESARGWSVTEQVSFGSLLPGAEKQDYRRVDFLLHHPTSGGIVVELDGTQHDSTTSVDAGRDAALRGGGLNVMRIPVGELRDSSGPAIDGLRSHLLAAPQPELDPLGNALRVSKWLHQIQCTVIEALKGGWLSASQAWDVRYVVPSGFSEPESLAPLVATAVDSVQRILERTSRLYDTGIQIDPACVAPFDPAENLQSGIVIAPLMSQSDIGSQPRGFYISDVTFPGAIAAPLTRATPLHANTADVADLEWFLLYLFRKESFWEGQLEAIQRTLAGKDSVVLLPTGAGKSIAFQLSGLLLPGRTVVVDPIISLIDDQIENLDRVGIDRCVGISGAIGNPVNLAYFQQTLARYLFIYVAPERFQIQGFRAALTALTSVVPITQVAIDEAHCVSEWGHDFRTSYLNLGRNARAFCGSSGHVPPLNALTGTASRIVLRDVQRELGIDDFDAVISPTSFDRPELRFIVVSAKHSLKIDSLDGLLGRLPSEFGVSEGRFFDSQSIETFSGIVFSSTVNGPSGVVSLSKHIAERFHIQTDFYSGGAPQGFDARAWNDVKRNSANRFKRNSTPLLAATSAFGMGIDKPNVRYTLHYGLPASIESFYQEAGRAGRDKKKALCAVVFADDDSQRSARLLGPTAGIDDIRKTLAETNRKDQDDVIQALWFHLQAFVGRDQEIEETRLLVEKISGIGNIGTRKHFDLSWDLAPGNDGKDRSEKALHRLVVLGVVEDYTVDYGGRSFGVQLTNCDQESVTNDLVAYIGAYQSGLVETLLRNLSAATDRTLKDFVLFSSEVLIDFVYEHIERARRRSLAEMLSAAQQAASGGDLRDRVLRHLEWSEFDDALDAVIASSAGGIDQLGPVLEGIQTATDAAVLRGTVARLLESYPDQPGLLLLRSLAESLSRDVDDTVVILNLEAAIKFARGGYGIEPEDIAQVLAQVVIFTASHSNDEAAMLNAIASSSMVDRDLLRNILVRLPIKIGSPILARLVRELAESSARLVIGASNG
jgi:ATP-dependent DNA helicase RecQ